MNYNKVKYRLYNNDTNSEIWLSDGKHTNNPAPKNWDESEKTLKRSTKTFGVYTELSKNLEFTKKGYDFLRSAFMFKDIEADVILEEYKRHPQTEAWYLHSTGTFDFSGYDYNENTFKVPFKSGGLNTLIQAYLKDKFELQRETSVKGDFITSIETKDVLLEGRDIFLISELSCEDETVYLNSGSQDEEDGKTHFEPVPLKIISNSDNTNIAQPFSINSDDVLIASTDSSGTTSNMFFIDSDVNKEDVRLDYSISFKVSEDSSFVGNVDDKDLRVRIKKYNTGNSFNNPQTVVNMIDINDNIFTYLGDTLTASGTFITDILIGESFSFVFEMEGDYGNAPAFMQLKFKEVNSTLTLSEDSSFDQTITKAVLMHNVGNQLSRIITGKDNSYYSEFYGLTDLGYDQDGEFSRTALTSGFYIRQFYDKNIDISLDNFLNTSRVIHNTGYGIETKNGVECLVHEDLKYFFQESIGIVLPNQVSNVVRKPATEFYDSSLIFGYKKGGDYEEAMGLDEYNVKTSYITNLTRVDTKYEQESDARADAYGREFARRKLKLNFPEQDTRYDKDLHLLDLKTGLGEVLEERKWQDDFDTIPQGIYSPETATNLRLTPREINNRHQWFYGASLNKFQDEKVRFSNSTGNSELSTKKIGEEIQYENGDINISDLEKPRFYPQWIEFDYKVDFYINEQVYGTTEINGREIPNYYFKIQFINERNETEFGYLFELKPNKEGKWKVLKTT